MSNSLDVALKSGGIQPDSESMATVLPDNPASQLRFFQAHASEWQPIAPQIGLTDAMAAEVVAATEAAAAAFRAAAEARQAAKAATLAWRIAAQRLRTVGGAAVKTIKSHADTTSDPNIYAAAGIAPPGRPGPKLRDRSEQDAAVPRVRNLSLAPDSRGGVELRWTCGAGETLGAGAGMFYRIERSINDGPPMLVNVVGGPGAGRRSNRYLDTSIPEGARTARYHITPMRGSATGAMSAGYGVTFAGAARAAALPAMQRAA